MPPFDDASELIADERCPAFSGKNLPTEPPTDPCGAFFNYATCCWKNHLGSAPVDFHLDDVLALASPTSARCRALALEAGWRPQPASSEFALILTLIVHYGNVSILGQLLDRLAPNGDGDRRSIADAAGTTIERSNLDKFRALMNHQSTAKATKTVKILQRLTQHWRIILNSDDLKEWTKLLTGLFDTLAVASADTISSPNHLLTTACKNGCMPIIEKLSERAKADTAFQKQLLQPTDGIGPLGEAVARGDIEMLRYLCQQHGIEAHAFNRDGDGYNIMAYCDCDPKVEIIKLLHDKFPWLMSERRGDDTALIKIIRKTRYGQTSAAVKAAKLILHHTQATPGQGLVDVDKLLAEAVWSGWPDMCRMLLVDGHADAQTVVKRSSSGRLEFKEHCLKDRWPEKDREPDEKILEAITGCLSEEVLEGTTGVQEPARKRVKRN